VANITFVNCTTVVTDAPIQLAAVAALAEGIFSVSHVLLIRPFERA
jgi:hypothetical protein